MRCWIVSLGALLTLFTACGPEQVYEHSRELPGFWTYSDSTRFDYQITDLAKRYDLLLEITHRTDFPTENLYARFATQYPDGTRKEQDLSLELADKYGQWYGSCAGETCTLMVPLQQQARFDQVGDYALTVYQHGRTDTLYGVDKLTFSIYEAPEME